MASTRCPKCAIEHDMYNPPSIERIHADMFAEPDWDDERFDSQPDDIPFEDEEPYDCYTSDPERD